MVVEAGRAERLPPHDIEAEEAVIASLLVDPEAIYKIAPTLTAQDFFREQNAWAYEACLALWERNESINQITVAHELARRGHRIVSASAWETALCRSQLVARFVRTATMRPFLRLQRQKILKEGDLAP
jgi:replicative DNA helicase